MSSSALSSAHRLLAAAFDDEGEDRAGRAHLAHRQIMLRMAGEAGMEHALHPRLDELADLERVLGLAMARSSSVSRPFSTTQALNGEQIGPGVALERRAARR